MTRNRQILTGYTDYVGMSSIMSGSVSLDPNMRIYFNNTVMLRDSMMTSPSGAKSFRTTVADNSQLLRPDALANLQGHMAPPQHTYCLRPEDLMGAQAANLQILQMGGGSVFDSRASIVQGVRTSHRDNGIATRYLAKSIQALGNAYTHVAHHNAPTSAVFNQAFLAFQEQQMYADQFFMQLNNRTNYQVAGFVTWAELCAVLPDADSICTVIRPSTPQQRAEQYQRGQLEHWQGSGLETSIANRLVSAVPGVMVENMLTCVFFSATNRTTDGRFAIEMHKDSIRSFTRGLDLSSYLARFESTLVGEILNTLTQNNLIDLDISVGIDFQAETRISVSISGGPSISFGGPIFCDALYTPVVTLNPQTLTDMGSDIDTLVSLINVPGPMFGVGANNPGFLG